tara:strand:- start:201 stop:641 length:441 start_codon:yes stop_codon:yes gene_type:complete
MTTRTVTTTVYTIESHPNKPAVYEWIRNNWHDLSQHDVDEFIASLKALADTVNGLIDYAIGASPDRGEFIHLTDYDKSLLRKLVPTQCALTGACWDYDVIHHAKKGNIEGALNILHLETEHVYSDKGLYNLCEANDYEFNEDGSIV